MAMGPDGLLYVSSFYDGSVLRFNPTTGDPAGIDPTATFASGAGNISGANSIVFDNAGNLDVVGLYVLQCVSI